MTIHDPYRKRVQLAAVRFALAERELELADFRSELAVFQDRHLRQLGVLYVELIAREGPWLIAMVLQKWNNL